MKPDPSRALPEPHILDCDWRYTAETILDLSALMRPIDNVLAVGAPSLARHLESCGRDVLLVDRQPFHAVRNHHQVEPGIAKPDFEKRAIAIIDPPWYPIEAKRWIAWAAHGTEPKGKMFVSLWPETTRPTAGKEFDEIESWASEWADFEVLDIVPRYDTPEFENAAIRSGGIASKGLSPGYGRLVCILPRSLPALIDYRCPRNTWIRFVVNDYQLAVCLKENGTLRSPVSQHPLAMNWTWPYVSKRAPQRDLINLWSSHNEVAILKDPELAVEALRKALKASEPGAFSDDLGLYSQLQDWDIPRPPYRRLLEWQHQQ
jgi:hypothetical protein